MWLRLSGGSGISSVSAGYFSYLLCYSIKAAEVADNEFEVSRCEQLVEEYYDIYCPSPSSPESCYKFQVGYVL